MSSAQPMPRFTTHSPALSCLPKGFMDNKLLKPSYDEQLALMLGGQNTPWLFDGSNTADSAYYIHSQPLVDRPIRMQVTAAPSSSVNFSYGTEDAYPNYQAPSLDVSCPRSYSTMKFMDGPMESLPSSFPPSAYQLEPRPHSYPSELADGLPQHSSEDHLQPQHTTTSEQVELFSASSGNAEERHGVIESVEPMERMSTSQSPVGSNYEPDINFDEMHLDKEEPYAKLIFRCLVDAPDHTMVLRDIYDWFREHTDKGKDPNTKGWQNSIRHNLSMNKAFEKIDVPPKDGQKKGFVWRLSKQALKDGVQSTTRFRNKQPNKRGGKSSNPLGYRQLAGAKGGAMARHAAAVRRSERLRKETQSRHSVGEMPDQSRNLLLSGTTPPPTGYEGYTHLDVSTSTFQPYYVQEQMEQLMSNRPMMAGSTVVFTPPMSEQSYPGSPVPQADVHFFPLGNRPLFYDSSETDSQPYTPERYGALDHFEDMALDPTVFLPDATRNDLAAYGGSDAG